MRNCAPPGTSCLNFVIARSTSLLSFCALVSSAKVNCVNAKKMRGNSIIGVNFLMFMCNPYKNCHIIP